MKILIADDSKLLRDRIKNSLLISKDVNIVGEATNGIEALQLIIEKEPDLIILDINMPKMKGIKVLEEIKDNEVQRIVCILTNYPYPQYRQKCLEVGADYFFDKNQDYDDLISLVITLSHN